MGVRVDCARWEYMDQGRDEARHRNHRQTVMENIQVSQSIENANSICIEPEFKRCTAHTGKPSKKRTSYTRRRPENRSPTAHHLAHHDLNRRYMSRRTTHPPITVTDRLKSNYVLPMSQERLPLEPAQDASKRRPSKIKSGRQTTRTCSCHAALLEKINKKQRSIPEHARCAPTRRRPRQTSRCRPARPGRC